MKRLVITGLLWLGLLVQGNSQPTVKESILKLKSIINYNEIDTFYQLNNYHLYWFGNNDTRNHLITLLNEADNYGLNEKDYQYYFIQKIKEGGPIINLQDSIEVDIVLSDAALHFFKELNVGAKPPSFRFNGLNYTPKTSNVSYLLKQYTESDQLNELVNIIQPVSKEYVALLKTITQFNKTVRDKNLKTRLSLQPKSITPIFPS